MNDMYMCVLRTITFISESLGFKLSENNQNKNGDIHKKSDGQTNIGKFRVALHKIFQIIITKKDIHYVNKSWKKTEIIQIGQF